jgi:hypothetical protein
MDIDIHVYLDDFQESIASPIKKINLFVDFEFLILDI